MIPRTLTAELKDYAKQYPIVTVTGPRQSGKTTLVRSIFPNHAYVSLEDLDRRREAIEDPRGFLAQYREGAIIDEAQNVPDLFSYLQTEVDQRPEPGRFILTGSQQFEMMERVSQSLAGRTAIARLLPLSLQELQATRKTIDLNSFLHSGFYPAIHDRELNPRKALAFYISTYLERDVRSVLGVTDLSRFDIFLRLCAGRAGQLLNTSSLGSEVGVSHNTIRSWLSVLEASFIIKLLPPWHANLKKRLVKSPKLYFYDVGLAAYLIGIQNAEQLQAHPLRGCLFENMMIAEAFKQQYNKGQSDVLSFFRDSQGNEVDLLIETGAGLRAYEIKSAQTIGSDFFKGLNYLNKLGVPIAETNLIYGGDESRTQSGHKIQSWREANFE
ncbi:MAG: ATP-binding protein [Opitutaceae bacterium]